MGKVSLQDLASVLVERWHLGKKEASLFVNEMFFVIQKSLDEDKIVKVKGLGTFKIIDVDDRESVDVNTGDRVLIEGHGKITFTPDALMKELVNKPFSQFETVVLNEGVDFNEAEAVSQPEETAIPDEVEDSSAPLVEFVDEPQPEIVEEPVKLMEPEVPETPAKPDTPKEPEKPKEQEKAESLDHPEKSEEIVEPKASEDSESLENSDSSENSENSESSDDSDDSGVPEEPEMPEETSAFKKYLKWIGIAVLTLAVGILIGYLMGNRSSTPQTPETPSVAAVDSNTVKALPEASDSIEAEQSDEEEEDLEEEDAEEGDEAPEAEDAQTDNAPEATAEDRPLDKWEAMDVRVKTGAYRILGTDTVVKAKAGDNLTRIGNRLLGPGMECYLEVYNGIKPGTALTAGQEIKIPKVELKKKKKKIE